MVGGTAVIKAAEKVVAKARKIAAHLLEASEDDLEFSGGRFGVRGTPGAGLGIQEIALAIFAAHNYPEGIEPSIDAEATFDPENFSFPHGTHICAMEVDTETGFVKIRKYACVDDVGTIVNPLIVEGQVHGGLAQGIAQALYEEAVYDADGNLTTGTFVDYLRAVGLGPAALRHRQHGARGDQQPARRQGRRRGRLHRQHARRGQRRPGRRPAPGGQRHPHAIDTRTRLAGDPSGR